MPRTLSIASRFSVSEGVQTQTLELAPGATLTIATNHPESHEELAVDLDSVAAIWLDDEGEAAL